VAIVFGVAFRSPATGGIETDADNEVHNGLFLLQQGLVLKSSRVAVHPQKEHAIEKKRKQPAWVRSLLQARDKVQQIKIARRRGGGNTTQLIQSQHRHQQDPEAPTFVSAFFGVLVGLVLIYLSLPVLWLNEKRNAKYESLIQRCWSDCKSLTADDFDQKNYGWPVHVTGKTVSSKPVKDKQFNVRFESGVMKILTVVEIYQYKETENRQAQAMQGGQALLQSRGGVTSALAGGRGGGGRSGGRNQQNTKKDYKAEWSDKYDAGDRFQDKKYKNTKPQYIEAGRSTQICSHIEFGKGFLLGDREIAALTGGEMMGEVTGQLIGGVDAEIDYLTCDKNTSVKFYKDKASGWWCSGYMDNPQVGDVRVKVSVLKDGPATIVGLQAEGSEKGRGSFLPYRTIPRPFCPCFSLTEDEEKQRLVTEAKRDPIEINESEMFHGHMACLCCGCNLIQMCLGVGMMPQILETYQSSLTKDQAFNNIVGQASMLKWVIRLGGWFMMFWGLYLLFGPFVWLLSLIPLGIGSFLSAMGAFIIGTASFFVTAVIASVVIALAYTMYHPVLGMMAFVMVGAVVAGILALCNTSAAIDASF
jgi:hypothetical protein